MSGEHSKESWHTERDVIQISGCSGVRAAFRQDDGTMDLCPVVGLAVCRVRTVRTCGGRVISRDPAERMVCGVVAGDGFELCENIGNFVAYVAPGEQIPGDWKLSDYTKRQEGKEG